jgi:glutaredoxin 3
MKSVTIYSTPVCKYCGHAKEFFKKHNIQYVEHNVAADAEKRAEMIDISGQMGVPVIQIDDNIVIGYNEKAFHELLGV